MINLIYTKLYQSLLSSQLKFTKRQVRRNNPIDYILLLLFFPYQTSWVRFKIFISFSIRFEDSSLNWIREESFQRSKTRFFMYTFGVKHRSHIPRNKEKIVQRNCINVRIHRRLFPSAFDRRPWDGFCDLVFVNSPKEPRRWFWGRWDMTCFWTGLISV